MTKGGAVTAFRFCSVSVKQQRTGLGVVLSKREPKRTFQRIWNVEIFIKEVKMSLYPLVISVAVLGLFIAISLLPVLFSEKDLDTLVLLPR